MDKKNIRMMLPALVITSNNRSVLATQNPEHTNNLRTASVLPLRLTSRSESAPAARLTTDMHNIGVPKARPILRLDIPRAITRYDGIQVSTKNQKYEYR